MRTKSLRKKLLATCFLLLCCAALFAQKADIAGKWAYTAHDVPAGYEAGTMTFSEKKGKLSGVVRIQGGDTETSEITQTKDAFRFSLCVDGAEVVLTLKREGDFLVGTAEAGGESFPISLERSK